jgi:hypothetical protein
MAKTMTELLSGETPPVWLDFYDYAGALLAGSNGIPWFDDASFAAFHGKAQSLLRSDVVALPVARIVATLLNARPELAAAMKAKSRPGFPLRRLLEEESLRQTVAGLLTPLRAAAADRPLALTLPSPRLWLAQAYAAAYGAPLDADVATDGDEIDGAAVYVADFLRSFADAGLDLVLLCEDANDGPANAEALSWYDPVFKTARHYRWEIGLLDPAGKLPAADAAALDFLISAEPGPAVAGGWILPAAFWSSGERAAGQGRFSYGTVPVGAVPEMVLDRIASLRRRG